MKKLLTILLIFFVGWGHAQQEDNFILIGEIDEDSSSLVQNRSISGLESLLKSENKIEIRLISRPSFTGVNHTIVLSYNENWKAKNYDYNTRSDSLIECSINMDTNIDTLFSKIVACKIFSIPDQSNLKYEKTFYNPKTEEFMGEGVSSYDGTCYYIEFKVGKKYRLYGHCNPTTDAKFYNVHELKDFVKIIELMDELNKKSR